MGSLSAFFAAVVAFFATPAGQVAAVTAVDASAALATAAADKIKQETTK